MSFILKRIKKILKIILLVLLGLILLFFIIIGIGRFINAQKYKIRSEKGVQKSEYVVLGGIEQYIQIRGKDVSNPVIILLHGGPGGNMAYYSYYWQADLEEYYTIVHWDQRGCGNTYYRNGTQAEKPTLELLLSDLDELTDYICGEYDKENVIIMGHSWGTFLGGIYAGVHPEKVSAYVGIGQFTDAWVGEQIAAEEAARLASEVGKAEDMREIENQFQLVRTSQDFNIREFTKLRQLTAKYLPSGDGMQISIGLFSPYMTLSDFRWFIFPMFNFDKYVETQNELCNTIYSEGGLSMYNFTTQYEVPIVIIAGDCDWTTPYNKAEDYFNDISAQTKEFILIENAGHNPFLDKPKEFSRELLKVLENIL